jgi:hypothetical protein
MAFYKYEIKLFRHNVIQSPICHWQRTGHRWQHHIGVYLSRGFDHVMFYKGKGRGKGKIKVKGKLSQFLTKHHAKRTYWGLEV